MHVQHTDGTDDWHFYKPKNGVMLEVFLDFEQGGALSFATDFIMLSLSNDFTLQLGYLNAVQSFRPNVMPTMPKKQFHECTDFTFHQAQFWVANSQSTQKAQAKSGSEKSQTTSKVLAEVSYPMFSVGEASLHPWLNQHTCQNYFRARRVFNVPAHLTVSKMADVLLYLKPKSTV